MRSPSDAVDTPVIVRDERVEDLKPIRRVVERAFGQAVEADLVDALRQGDALTLSLVAEAAGEIVGHVAFSPVIIRAGDTMSEALGLAPLVVHTIFEAIDEIKSKGTTILLVEQNAHAALGHSDRAYVLETGRIVMEGPSKDLANDPRIKEAYLGE